MKKKNKLTHLPNSFRRPLSRYPVILTEDLDTARQQIFETFGADAFEAEAGEQFFICSNFLQLESLGICYAEYGGPIQVGFPEATFVRQLFNISGRGQFNAAAASISMSQQMPSPVIPSDIRYSMQADTPYSQLVLRIEASALKRTLAALLGEELPAELTFLNGIDEPSELKASLKRKLFFFAAEFNEIGRSLSPIAAAEFERSLISKFLICNRHTYSEKLLSEEALAANSQVKLVEEYIEAHWQKPLDIAALAALTSTSVRSLFRQFNKSRDYSPMEFLKFVRLRQARLMLLSGSDNSVLSVMLKCGFQNAGHFARDYRRAFGERPSDTLRRSS